jgi:hypothetical protein
MLDIRVLGQAIAKCFQPPRRGPDDIPDGVFPGDVNGGAASVGMALVTPVDATPAESLPDEPLRIKVTRGPRSWLVDPAIFETFGFRDGDILQVTPAAAAAGLPTTWGDVNVPVAPGEAIRVPER